MTWPIVAGLIVQYGIPLVDKLVSKWSAGVPVTLADWEEISAIAQQTAEDRLKAKLVEAGVSLDSEQAKALLSLARS